MNKHTPGPYHTDGQLIRNSDGEILASTSACSGDTLRNAVLFAAAPELLAACKALLSGMLSMPGVDQHIMVPDSNGMTLREISEVIAKAEG